MSNIIALHRERQTRRPVRDRYAGPCAAVDGARAELDHLDHLAGQALLVDGTEVTAAVAEVRRVLDAVLDAYDVVLDQLEHLQPPAGEPR